jgi:hypothetical protein
MLKSLELMLGNYLKFKVKAKITTNKINSGQLHFLTKLMEDLFMELAQNLQAVLVLLIQTQHQKDLKTRVIKDRRA